jgi:hypothetical protein
MQKDREASMNAGDLTPPRRPIGLASRKSFLVIASLLEHPEDKRFRASATSSLLS